MTYPEFHNGIVKLFAEALKSRLSIEEMRSMIAELLDEAEEVEERNEAQERNKKSPHERR